MHMKGHFIMKSTGIVRRIDELGRFVLPIEIRENLDIGPKDPLEIYGEGSRIILKKFQPCCIFCGEADNVILYRDKLVCAQCRKDLSEKNL